VRVDCPSGITEAGTPITFTASVSGGAPGVTATYNWSVSAGTITGGQGTPSITVDTKGLGGQSITATVQVGGYPPECQTTASCTAQVGITAICRKFDEYGNIAFNDEKARLRAISWPTAVALVKHSVVLIVPRTTWLPHAVSIRDASRW
jgi:hypothetical protein